MKKDNIKLAGVVLMAGAFMIICGGCSTANSNNNTEPTDNTNIITSVLDATASDNEESKLLYSVNSDNSTITITGFEGSADKLYIPEIIDSHTVTSIGDYAFFKTDVTEVTFPKTIVKIGEAAFYGCSKLKTVSFADSDIPLVTINSYSFANCGSLESVVIPMSTTVICDYAFTNCLNLSNIVIGEATTLKELAFWGCPGSPIEYEDYSVNTHTVTVPDGYEYSDWTTVETITSETPMQTTADDTRRILSNGYTTTLSEEGTKIAYEYIVQEREKTEKFKEVRVSTYNYGVFVEEDRKVAVKWYYNQSSAPVGAFPLSMINAKLEELTKELEDLYENGKLGLKKGEEPTLTPNGLCRYGSWVETSSFTLDFPMTLISGSTFRIVSGGYSNKTTESGTSFVYKYFFHERCKYYNTTAVKIIIDDNGNRQWLDEDGEVVLSDNDYSEWNDLETITSEIPEEIYEKELERVIPLEHEIVTDENGTVNIIYHYVHQTRQHK